MAKQTNINYRQRLIELYNIHRIKTAKALDAWRKDNKIKKPTFRPEEWKGIDLHKAMQMHENQVNLIYIKQTMTDNDVEWVVKDIVNSSLGLRRTSCGVIGVPTQRYRRLHRVLGMLSKVSMIIPSVMKTISRHSRDGRRRTPQSRVQRSSMGSTTLT